MKYGLLIYFGSTYCNFGDYVQSIAIEYLYREVMKIPNEQIVYVTQQELSTYDGEPILLPYSYVLSFLLDDKREKACLSKKITPIFLGASVEFATLYDAYPLDNFKDKEKGYFELFLNNGPVGCRDNFTRSFLQDIGIDAYIQSCITNILPYREEGDYKKIMLVDVPVEALQFIPDELLPYLEVVNNAADIGELSYEENYERIKSQYEYYYNNASMVISSRYHVVTPCNAMGIPAIFVKRKIDKHIKDIRLDTLHPDIQLVENYDFSKVDFYKKISFDKNIELKQNITSLAIKRMKNTSGYTEEIDFIKNFYQNRIKEFSEMQVSENSYNERLSEYITENHREIKGGFYIWGAIELLCDGNDISLVEIINSVNPNLVFKGWVDTYKKGCLANRKIFSPNDFELGENEFVVVAAETAADYAKKFFDNRNYDKTQYVILANVIANKNDINNLLKNKNVTKFYE